VADFHVCGDAHDAEVSVAVDDGAADWSCPVHGGDGAMWRQTHLHMQSRLLTGLSLWCLCTVLAAAQHREQFVGFEAKLTNVGARQDELDVRLDGTASQADVEDIRRELSALEGARLLQHLLPCCRWLCGDSME
jgi:hypothetical protein